MKKHKHKRLLSNLTTWAFNQGFDPARVYQIAAPAPTSSNPDEVAPIFGPPDRIAEIRLLQAALTRKNALLKAAGIDPNTVLDPPAILSQTADSANKDFVIGAVDNKPTQRERVNRLWFLATPTERAAMFCRALDARAPERGVDSNPEWKLGYAWGVDAQRQAVLDAVEAAGVTR